MKLEHDDAQMVFFFVLFCFAYLRKAELKASWHLSTLKWS